MIKFIQCQLYNLKEKNPKVCYVGIIRNVIKRANDTTYVIDDMTTPHTINVKLQADVSISMKFYKNKITVFGRIGFIENFR